MKSSLVNIIIRPPTAKDASALMDFGNKLLAETDYYVRKAGERANTPTEMLRIINWYNETASQVMMHAWEGDNPVGEVVLMAGQLSRTAKTAQLGIGVLKSHYNMGIGQKLMETAEIYASNHAIHRIEFTVFANNKKAGSFYKNLGYIEEGRKKESVFINNQHLDEILMGKIIEPPS